MLQNLPLDVLERTALNLLPSDINSLQQAGRHFRDTFSPSDCGFRERYVTQRSACSRIFIPQPLARNAPAYREALSLIQNEGEVRHQSNWVRVPFLDSFDTERFLSEEISATMISGIVVRTKVSTYEGESGRAVSVSVCFFDPALMSYNAFDEEVSLMGNITLSSHRSSRASFAAHDTELDRGLDVPGFTLYAYYLQPCFVFVATWPDGRVRVCILENSTSQKMPLYSCIFDRFVSCHTSHAILRHGTACAVLRVDARRQPALYTWPG